MASMTYEHWKDEAGYDQMHSLLLAHSHHKRFRKLADDDGNAMILTMTEWLRQVREEAKTYGLGKQFQDHWGHSSTALHSFIDGLTAEEIFHIYSIRTLRKWVSHNKDTDQRSHTPDIASLGNKDIPKGEIVFIEDTMRGWKRDLPGKFVTLLDNKFAARAVFIGGFEWLIKNRLYWNEDIGTVDIDWQKIDVEAPDGSIFTVNTPKPYCCVSSKVRRLVKDKQPDDVRDHFAFVQDFLLAKSVQNYGIMTCVIDSLKWLEREWITGFSTERTPEELAERSKFYEESDIVAIF